MAQAGCYVYRVAGAIMAREPWSVHHNADGSVQVRAVRDATQFGVWMAVEADILSEDRADYRLELRASAEGPVVKAVCYHRDNGALFMGPQRQEIVPRGAHFFPLMRYFTKDMIAAILKRGGSHHVVVPDISDVGANEKVFAPLYSVRTVVPVSGDLQAFDLSGGAYEVPARLIFNDQGLLAHFAFTDSAGKVWSCDLETES
jgi:hypothetical protein